MIYEADKANQLIIPLCYPHVAPAGLMACIHRVLLAAQG